MTRKNQLRSNKGYAGVVAWHPKHETNVGTLWRSAFLYDCAFIGTIGRRYEKQASDTPHTANRLPLWHFQNVDDLHEHLPKGCPLIGVELTPEAIPLHKFWHPLNAVYLMGAEDNGLPESVLDKCHQVVQIPTPQPWSMNVAVAGSIVLYHRYLQGMS